MFSGALARGSRAPCRPQGPDTAEQLIACRERVAHVILAGHDAGGWPALYLYLYRTGKCFTSRLTAKKVIGFNRGVSINNGSSSREAKYHTVLCRRETLTCVKASAYRISPGAASN